MRGPYPGELRVRVIRFVDGGASRREAAEQFDVSVSSAIRWMQRFRDDGSCEPMPRGGSTSPLEKYSERILGLIREHPDLTLDEMVLALRKRRIPASRSARSGFRTEEGGSEGRATDRRGRKHEPRARGGEPGKRSTSD